MIYEFDSRVRYSELDQNGELALSSVINYFQDCSTFHSEAIGLGLDNLTRKHRAWVLSSWQIVIDQAPKLGEKITVQTWPYDFIKFYGYRNFTILDETGKRMIWANSIWVHMDLETHHPTRGSEDEIAGYTLEKKLEMDYAPRKIPVPKESVAMEPYTVLKYQLDTNNHVNNGQYILMAQEYLPDSFKICQMRAEYKKAAVLHDTIIPKVALKKNSCTVALCDEQERPYAVVAFDTTI